MVERVEHATKIGAGGRLVIPRAFRTALQVEAGDTVILVLEPDGLWVMTPTQAVARAQAMVQRYIAADRSLADELVQDRLDDSDAP